MIRSDVFYKMPAGQNMYFIRKGRVMVYDGVMVRESIITILELQNAVNRGYVHSIRPASNAERDILGVNPVKEEAPRKRQNRPGVVDFAMVAMFVAFLVGIWFL